MFFEVFLDFFLYKDSVFYKCGFVDLDLENVLMQEEVTQETNGFRDEGLSFMMIVDRDG